MRFVYRLVTTREFGTIDILGLDNVAIVFFDNVLKIQIETLRVAKLMGHVLR